MSNNKKIILSLIVLVFIAVPLVSFAADIGKYNSSEGLVPCGSKASGVPYCNLCYLYILIQRILDFVMWYITPVVAVLAIGIAGFKILISGANPGQRADGYKIIRTTITGLVIMFSAWVVMNEVLLFFTGYDSTNHPNFLQSPWNQVVCKLK